MYVSRYEKAHKFALAFDRRDRRHAEVIISFRYPKYASYEDVTGWFICNLIYLSPVLA